MIVGWITDLLGSGFQTLSDMMGDVLAHLIDSTLAYMLFMAIFYLILVIITHIVILVYLIALFSLFFNIPAILNAEGQNILPSTSGTLSSSGYIMGDVQLTAFNSIFGWSIMGVGGLFILGFIIFIMVNGILKTIRTRLWWNDARTNTNNKGLGNWTYGPGEGFWKNLFKGAVWFLATIILLGIMYFIFTLLSIVFCILVVTMMNSLMGGIMNKLTSGADATSNANWSGGYSNNTTYAPSLFGSLSWFDYQTYGGNVTYLALPVYIYYLIFHYAGFSPSIPAGQSGLNINVMSSGFLTKAFLLDSLGGIGFILVPWYILVLAIVIYSSLSMLKVFVQSILRVFVLVFYFIGIIIASIWAFADGGKQVKKMIVSAGRWFFYNLVFVIALNGIALILFLFIYVGNAIYSAVASWDSFDNALGYTGFVATSTPATNNFMVLASTSNPISSIPFMSDASGLIGGFILPAIQWMLGSFGQGFSFINSLLIFIMIVVALATAKVQIFDNLTNRYFGDDDLGWKSKEAMSGAFKQLSAYALTSSMAVIGASNFSRGLTNRYVRKPVNKLWDAKRESRSFDKNTGKLLKQDTNNKVNSSLLMNKKGQVVGYVDPKTKEVTFRNPNAKYARDIKKNGLANYVEKNENKKDGGLFWANQGKRGEKVTLDDFRTKGTATSKLSNKVQFNNASFRSGVNNAFMNWNDENSPLGKLTLNLQNGGNKMLAERLFAGSKFYNNTTGIDEQEALKAGWTKNQVEDTNRLLGFDPNSSPVNSYKFSKILSNLPEKDRATAISKISNELQNVRGDKDRNSVLTSFGLEPLSYNDKNLRLNNVGRIFDSAHEDFNNIKSLGRLNKVTSPEMLKEQASLRQSQNNYYYNQMHKGLSQLGLGFYSTAAYVLLSGTGGTDPNKLSSNSLMARMVGSRTMATLFATYSGLQMLERNEGQYSKNMKDSKEKIIDTRDRIDAMQAGDYI